MQEHNRLLSGDILIDLSYHQDDIVGVSGRIFIKAPPEKVWKALTDYDNLSNTLPKVVASRTIEKKNGAIILEQTGKTGILIFEKTVNFRLKIYEEYLHRVSFEQVSGDFHVYQGEWLLETHREYEGTILHYRAKIKPLFFAPPILVSFVQRQDLPGILSAHKKRAETNTFCH
ncbi:SRPBCC family protein [Prosthecochloris sp. SCSIO W1103]|uniref:SRPBCC family protein n=1 Tax=Prosthecochloris sp. SCSIO W1103 TaxID=2992244 RepID=UPI00223E4208|nr:SRPBCC family protein [Prosthecochloris sp. SCSIO W1103]UZJ37012.1 SRPBCC family protein [Prosthecochloris sp. SCSIO W1103]